jgi:hypothetical protein
MPAAAGGVQFRLSYENGIQTFDTANVSPSISLLFILLSLPPPDGRPPAVDGPSIDRGHWQVYSNGASEIILGKAIKQLNLPREGIVVMTKVRYDTSSTPRRVR